MLCAETSFRFGSFLTTPPVWPVLFMTHAPPRKPRLLATTVSLPFLHMRSCMQTNTQEVDPCAGLSGVKLFGRYPVLCSRGQKRLTRGLCRNCDPGMYQPLDQHNETQCLPCGPGHYANEFASHTCLPCLPGKTSYPNESPAKECTDCPERTYSPYPGHSRECFPCITATQKGESKCNGCDPGKHKAAAGSAANCTTCRAGLYSARRDQTSCKECPEGYHGGGVNPRIHCAACNAGMFGDSTSARNASSGCKDCPSGRYSEKEGLARLAGAQIESICKHCPRGRYGTETAAQSESACKHCLPGRYGTDTAANNKTVACKSCKDGTYSEQIGFAWDGGSNGNSEPCTKCPVGYYQSERGREYCLPW